MPRPKHQVFGGDFKYFGKKKKKRYKIQLKVLVLVLVLFVSVGYGWFHKNIIKELPDVSKVEDIVFSESTVITDRNGEELYKLFQENREYITLDQVSEHMINAIIAVEDQSFWTNAGIDLMGILRGVSGVLVGDTTRGGGSTITQQLLKNILLDASENKYKRKLKEWMLAGKLNDSIKTDLNREYKDLSGEELKQKMKEKILELYLNYIFLGQNAYGVQAASRTYFSTTADKLDPLKSSIIASLPKSPSRLNPYKNKDLLMGQVILRRNEQTVNPPEGLLDAVHDRIESNLKNVNFDQKGGGSFVKVILGLTDFTITHEGVSYQVAYTPGRKDFSLMNMFDEGYIDQVQLKKAFVQGLDYNFEEGKIEIKAPHFVHRIQEILEEDYEEEALMKGGLVVKTSLDYQIQQWAESAVAKNYRAIEELGGNNAGLVYINSTNGDVLAYVGSADYFNEDIDGKVDMVRALRQPGSSIKPFIYALGFDKLPLTLDTPIYDLPMQIGGNRPNNVDGQFKGLMPMREALAHSRNIPPIKLFLSVGGEKVVKPFLKAIGLKSLSEGISYGYPLSIGAGEVQMIELANAYMHLSAGGKPGVINPILEIRTNDGAIVYQKQPEKQKQVIQTGIASLIRSILSNRENMPGGRIGAFTIRGMVNAVKSGTSDVKVKQDNGVTKSLPRDGRLATYTPSRVGVFRAGNTNAAPMSERAYGLTLNSAVRKDFFTKLGENNFLPNENYPQAEVKSLKIDKTNGFAVGEGVPLALQVDTRGYISNLPESRDRSGEIIKYDTMCQGKWTPLVPPEDTKEGYVIQPYSIMPDNRDVEKIKERIASETGMSLFIKEPETICEDRAGEEDDNIAIEIIKPEVGATVTKNFEVRYNISGERPLKYVRIYLNDVVVVEQEYKRGETSITDIKEVIGYAGIEPGEQLVTIEVVDEVGFFNKKSTAIRLSMGDANPPYLMEDRLRVEPQDDGTRKVFLLFADDESVVKGGTITIDEQEQSFSDNLAVFTVEPGQKVFYSVEDIFTNKKSDELVLQLGE